MTNKTDDKMGQIDQAIAAARQRKADRGGTPIVSKGRGSTAEKAPRIKLTAEEKAAHTIAKDAKRTAVKAMKDRIRTEKRAERDASKPKPHLAKVLKAAARLPTLGTKARGLFNEITVNLPAVEAASLAMHLVHFNRANATQRAIGQKLEVGQPVRVIGGDPRFIGMMGNVSRAQRIRAYVTLPGVKKDIYVFISEVEPVTVAKTAIA